MDDSPSSRPTLLLANGFYKEDFMLIVKTWKTKWLGCGYKYSYKGWFLLGIIPLFIIRTSN